MEIKIEPKVTDFRTREGGEEKALEKIARTIEGLPGAETAPVTVADVRYLLERIAEREAENASLKQDAARWRCLMRLVDECKVSVLFEGESDTIDGGLIETDLGEIAERIDAAMKESEGK